MVTAYRPNTWHHNGFSRWAVPTLLLLTITQTDGIGGRGHATAAARDRLTDSVPLSIAVFAQDALGAAAKSLDRASWSFPTDKGVDVVRE